MWVPSLHSNHLVMCGKDPVSLARNAWPIGLSSHLGQGHKINHFLLFSIFSSSVPPWPHRRHLSIMIFTLTPLWSEKENKGLMCWTELQWPLQRVAWRQVHNQVSLVEWLSWCYLPSLFVIISSIQSVSSQIKEVVMTVTIRVAIAP